MTGHAVPRVLHCVERMHTNAIETWLARMHRHARNTGVATDWWFHVQLPKPGLLEQDDPAIAGRVIRSPCTLSQGVRFFREFRRLCRSGRFDVIHVHADLMSAPYVMAARSACRARTIVHVHNADEQVPTPSRLKRWLMTEPFRRIGLSADRVVGISNHTLDTFLAGRRRRPQRDAVHYYGVDPTSFTEIALSRVQFREQIGLQPDDRVLLFAGRLVPEKNPLFAVEVLAAMRALDSSVHAVFAGAGDMEAEVCTLAEALGVGQAVHMLGWRQDVPAIMAASDWFILPRPEHPMEGFGLAVVEAQLAGLRLLLSLGVPDDPLLPTAQVRRIALAEGPRRWAEAAIAMLQHHRPEPGAARAALAASPMDMDTALRDLMALHG